MFLEGNFLLLLLPVPFDPTALGRGVENITQIHPVTGLGEILPSGKYVTTGCSGYCGVMVEVLFLVTSNGILFSPRRDDTCLFLCLIL